MVRNRDSFSFKFLLGVVLTIGFFSSSTTGIVVRLGDSGVSYRSSATAFGSDHQLGVAPHLIASPRLKYPAVSIPLAYFFRQLPFLATYTRENARSPASANVLPPAPVSPKGLPPATTSPATWADHSPLPFYPLTTSQSPSESVPTEGDARHQQQVQLYSAQLRGEIIPVLTPIPKKVTNKEKNVAGRPGIDYPTYGEIPQTSFSCKEQRYKGFFGDPETRCQAWHYCDFNGGQASFLCPNGTIFSQVLFTCDWWFNVHCNSTLQAYVINERLYKYIIPMAPSFPEDFQGPEVNQYLALKFMELMQKEEKKLKEKKLKESKVEKEKSEEFDGLGENASDDALLNRQYLIQALSNDLGNKQRDSRDSKNVYLSQ